MNANGGVRALRGKVAVEMWLGWSAVKAILAQRVVPGFLDKYLARQNVRLERSPGAVGPLGRTLLFVALFALVGLLAVWVLLAL